MTKLPTTSIDGDTYDDIESELHALKTLALSSCGLIDKSMVEELLEKLLKKHHKRGDAQW